MSEQPESVFGQTSSMSGAGALLDLGFPSEAESAGVLASSPQKPGDFVGRYRLVAPLGEGGFGLVWEAEQTEPIRRELALKLIKPGLDSREIIARFEAERQALALMDHPNIAAVHDAGTADDGRPYFAMELVKGEPITTYCDRHRLGVDQRLALFIPVCRAVQHAHQKSILHRDLKPSNILVATVDGKPAPKVIDFGIAKALVGNESDALVDMVRTRMGVAIGTPRYMSPEQAGSMPDVDTRSDVYSLGVVLCELLTGQPPHPSQPGEFMDALRWIRESDPVKPSTLARGNDPATEEAARRRGMDSRKLARRLEGDLDWITLKAVEKDRALRYDTATALALDLERYLAEEPVSAMAPTWRYQFGKFARRQRGALIAASLIVAALIAGTVVSLWQASRANQSRQEAERRRAEARDAVVKYLVEVTANPKLNQSNFWDLRRELLEKAVPLIDEISQYRGDDFKLLSARATASAMLANLSMNIGDMEKAEGGYRRVVDDLTKLAARFPKATEPQLNLGLRLDEFALVLKARGRLEEALVEHDRAVKVVAALAHRSKDVPHYQRCLARVLYDRAVTLDSMQRDDDLSDDVKQVTVIGKKLVSQYPNNPDYWMILAVAASVEASPFFRHQRNVEGVGALRRAVEYFERAAKLQPTSQNRYVLAYNRGRLGMALSGTSLVDAAEFNLRKAVEELQKLVDEFPSYRDYRSGLILCQQELSKDLLSKNKNTQSNAVLEQVRLNQERLVGDFPAEARYSQELAKTVAILGDRAKTGVHSAKTLADDERAALAQPREFDFLSTAFAELLKGNYEHAANIAREVATLNPGDWESLESAAEVMAGALPFIRVDNKLAAEARDKQAEDWSAQAVDFLKQAMANGYTGMAYFNTLPCAGSLQQRPDYQALLAAPVAPPAHCPKKFIFEYTYNDPGSRRWVRDGLTWTETQPSGIKNIYTITGPFVLDGMPGAKLVRMSPSHQTVFVPELGAAKKLCLWMRKADGAWTRLDPIRDVE